MSEQMQLPNAEVADAQIVGLHKQAFFGRLKQYGVEPANMKEATALLDLGVGLMQQTIEPSAEKQAAAQPGSEYGEGFYAGCLRAFDSYVSPAAAPGFESVGKKASLFEQEPYQGPAAELPPALVDATYDAAWNLAQNPTIYGAAVVKRAANEAQLLELYKQAGGFTEQPAK